MIKAGGQLRSVSPPQVCDKDTDTFSKPETWHQSLFHRPLFHCVFRSSPAQDTCPRLDPNKFHSDDVDEK